MQAPRNLSTLADLGHGDHACNIYGSDEEYAGVAGEFIRHGLAAGERVICVRPPEAAGREEAALERLGVDAAEPTAAGRLVMLTGREILWWPGGEFDRERLASAFLKQVSRAVDDGSGAVRLNADMTWLVNAVEDVQALLEFEARLNDLFPTQGCVAICHYDLRRFGATTLLGALATHPVAVVSGRPCDNFYFRPPVEYLERDSPADRLARRLENLLRRGDAERELRHRLRIEEAVARASRMLVGGSDADIRAVLGLLGEAVGANRAYIFLLRDGGRIDNTHEWCDAGTRPEIANLQDIEAAAVPWWMERLGANENVLVENVDEMPDEGAHERAMLQAQGIKSLVVVPMWSAGALMGFMGFDATESLRTWAGQDIKVLRMASEMIGGYLARVRAEEALRDSEAFNRCLFENMSDVVYVVERGRHVRFLNNAFERITGRTGDTRTGREMLAMIHPEDAQRTVERFRRAFGGETLEPIEVRVLTSSGQVRYLESRATPIFRNGGVVAVLGVGHDIHERKVAEQALRESEANYRAIFEAVNDAIFVHDMETGEVLDVNRKMCELFKCTPEEARGLPAERTSAGFAPYTAADTYRWARKAWDAPQLFEWLARDLEGNLIWVEVSLQRTTISGRDRLLAVVRDIGERKRAEEALRNSASLLSAMIDQSPVATWIADADGTAIRQNAACRALFGVDSDEQIVGRYNLFRDPLLREAGHLAAIEAVFKEGTTARAVIDYDLSKVPGLNIPNARRCLLQATVFPIRDSSGKVVNAVIQHEDMTEQRRLEEQLRQAQKMEAVGRLAGGIAHDFNNVLAAIMGYSDLVLAHMDDRDPGRRDVEEIRRAGERAASLTKQLLTFSRNSARKYERVDLNSLVAGMEKMLRLLAGDSIRMELALDPAARCVLADAGQLEQVVMNLAMNARDAMPHGGVISIRTAPAVLDVDSCRAFTNVTPGLYTLLAVSDTGEGIDAEARQHLFEPFFTTKERGRGTGLGLATVYGIVKQAGGGISVASEPGKGATFRVYLPLATGDESLSAAPATPASLDARTVLLVEDEEVLVEFLSRVLEARGLRVIKAATGPHAVEICGDSATRIDLMITDVNMPGMSGTEVAKAAAAMRPGLNVLYISGYAGDLAAPGAPAHFLQKPFTSDALASKVMDILAAPGE